MTSLQQLKVWLRNRALGVILSMAAGLVMISLFLPPIFDLVVDLIMFGLIAVAGRLAKK